MEASARYFWRRGGGLEGLEDWLLSHRVEASTATFVTDTIWFYYWYFLWPAAQDVLPVGISASSERSPLVRLTVPMAQEADSTRGVPEDQIPRLEEEFEGEVAAPLREEVRMEIAFVPADAVTVPLNRHIGEGAVGGEEENHTEFAGDLLQDLQALMPAEALDQWIDTPNARFGGAAPRALLRTPGQRFLRDLVLEARHGLPT